MNERSAAATVSVRVAAAPAVAFDLFTRELDLWWRRGPKYRHAAHHEGTISIEPRPGGRVCELWRDARGEHEFEIGTVLAWEPPRRLVWSWRNATFAPIERTEVEVTFAAAGEGTLVTVRHRGWEALRDDHPARHGHVGAAFGRFLGLWWGEQLTALREHAAARRGP